MTGFYSAKTQIDGPRKVCVLCLLCLLHAQMPIMSVYAKDTQACNSSWSSGKSTSSLPHFSEVKQNLFTAWGRTFKDSAHYNPGVARRFLFMGLN